MTGQVCVVTGANSGIGLEMRAAWQQGRTGSDGDEIPTAARRRAVRWWTAPVMTA